MTSASLFRKLQEHELELGILEKHENQEKKPGGIALKVDKKKNKKNMLHKKIKTSCSL